MLGLQLIVGKAHNTQEVDEAFARFVQQGAGALLVAADPFFILERDQLVALAVQHRLPAIYPVREFTDAGGLISYGDSLADKWRQAGGYAGRILQGTKPADLPMQQPTKFELVVNQRAAQALGLTIPPHVLLQATEVIQ